MLSLCLSTSPFASPSSTTPFQEDPYDDLSSPCCRPCTAPVPIGAHLEENGMQRSASSSSASAESLCSVRSNTSTRSAAEREAERRERRRLLDVSIAKIQGPNQPLHRHLLVYNAVKELQRELDCLDEEELYVCLMEPAVDAATEVDHWLAISEQSLRPAPFEEDEEEMMTEKTEEVVDVVDDSSWTWPHHEDTHDGLSFHQDLARSSTPFWQAAAPASFPMGCGGGWASAWALSSTWPTSAAVHSSSSSLRDDLDDDVIFTATDEWSMACQPLSARDLLHLLPMQA